jgi:glycosyltransferase involved in cell wall biosynthesis
MERMCMGQIKVMHVVTDSISTVLMRGQLAYLQANGFDLTLVSNPGDDLERTAHREGCSAFGVPMKREISPISDLLSLFKMCKLLLGIKPLICNSGTPKAGLLTGIAGWLTGVPCRVYTLRGLRMETAKGLRKAILRIAEKVTCLCADRVVCVSASLRERAIALRLVPRKKTVLLGLGSSNGVDPDRFEPTAERAVQAAVLRKNLGIQPSQPVIGFVGRLTRDKGVQELVAAFQMIREELPEAILLLVGDYEKGDPIPDATRDAIESEAGILHVENSPQIEIYYHVMNIFVLPTYREGLPNTVLEAQAARLPVITTMATGAVDAIEGGITGLFTPVGDAGRLAEAVLSLLRNSDEMQLMGQKGRERVLRVFRNEVVWEGLASLYRTMLREHGYSLPASPGAEDVRCAQTP